MMWRCDDAMMKLCADDDGGDDRYDVDYDDDVVML